MALLDPPAYQEYAANMLTNLHFRRLNLAQRGLLWTLRLELWANKQLPSQEADLAAILGVSVSELRENLPILAPFLANKQGMMIAPDLDNYRAELDSKRARQSEGGKKGADTTNSRRAGSVTSGAGNPQTSPPSRSAPKPKSTRSSPDGSLEQPSPDQSSTSQEIQTQSLKKSDVDPWISSYEAAETSPNAYLLASRGH